MNETDKLNLMKHFTDLHNLSQEDPMTISMSDLLKGFHSSVELLRYLLEKDGLIK